MKLSRLTKEHLKLAPNDGGIAHGLDKHRHIVKVVGTCLQICDATNLLTGKLHILMFPVAHCDLGQLLEVCAEVCESSRTGYIELPGGHDQYFGSYCSIETKNSAKKTGLEMPSKMQESMPTASKFETSPGTVASPAAF